MRNHLVIMAKRPTMGRVKTRLAKHIGNAAAYKFFNNNLKMLMQKLSHDPRFKLHVATTPKSAISERFWPVKVNVFEQGEGNLGRRMNAVFRHVSASYKATNILIIGSDIPDINPQHIMHGFKTLGNKKVCFGPSDDGGYWLVGQRMAPKIDDLFSNVRWSTEYALADCLANLEHDKVGFIDRLNDVDDFKDYQQYLEKLR